MPSKRILILGGTSDAIELSQLLTEASIPHVVSLAGVTQSPRLPQGDVRIGGFGGLEAMADYIRAQGFTLVADATHPFAMQISQNAAHAARQAGVHYVRLERPAWQPQAGANWIRVSSVEEAVSVLPQRARVFLTIGRKALAPFVARADLSGIARMIEPPSSPLPQPWSLLLARPPFAVEEERNLLTREKITHLVTKNAGGSLAAAKLQAAGEAGVAVVMIERPPKPKARCFADAKEVGAFIAANN